MSKKKRVIHLAVHFGNVLVVCGESASIQETSRHYDCDAKGMVFNLTLLGQFLVCSHLCGAAVVGLTGPEFLPAHAPY